MTVEYKIISIGTLSHNRLWGEAAAVRAAHATTTLVIDEDKKILVDPSLPAKILSARFNERTGNQLDDVTDVFCTTLRPIHRRGIEALPNANWWVAKQELEAYRNHLAGLLDSAERLEAEHTDEIRVDLEILNRFRPVPQRFTKQVQLYPLVGASAASAGLLLTPATSTIVIAGDAAITSEHIHSGQVWKGCFDTEKAMESLRDLLELADIIIPGHDNLTHASSRWI